MIILQARRGVIHILDICEARFKLSLCEKQFINNKENIFSISYIEDLPPTLQICVKCKAAQDFIATRIIKEKSAKSFLLEKNANLYNISKNPSSMEHNFWFLDRRYWRKLQLLKRKALRL